MAIDPWPQLHLFLSRTTVQPIEDWGGGGGGGGGGAGCRGYIDRAEHIDVLDKEVYAVSQ